MKQKVILLIAMMTIMIVLTGCHSEKLNMKKIKDVDFTVVEETNIPKELLKMIQQKKKKPFQMSYSNKEFLYIAVGYGQKKMGGYSVAVNRLYETNNAVCIDTNLIGPKKRDTHSEVKTYPYIVVKMEFVDKSIVFE